MSGTGKMYLYGIKEDIFREGIEKLAKGGLKVTSYDDTEINGTFTAENDGVLYTSIPHDGGWTAYIDGEEAEITPLKDALVCIPVTAGEHELTLKYCPPGFAAGATVTVVSIIAFVAAWIVEKKYIVKVKAKKAADAAKAEITQEYVDSFEQACEEMKQPVSYDKATENTDIVADSEKKFEEAFNNLSDELEENTQTSELNNNNTETETDA